MHIGKLLAAVAAASMVCGASEPIRLTPTSKWVLDYGDESCRLLRTFGEGEDKIVLVLESAAPGEASMVAIGAPLRSSRFAEAVSTRFLPVQKKPFYGRSAQSAGTGKPAVLWSSVPLAPVLDESEMTAEDKADREAARAAAKSGTRPPPRDLVKIAAAKAEREAFARNTTAIQIDSPRGRTVVLETGSLGEPIKMFDQCGRDQLRGWGIDPTIEDKIVRPVWAPDAQSWFTSDDYPVKYGIAGEESNVSVRLLVDATGKVTKCTSLSHVDAPEFGQTVCAIFLERAKFYPAELAGGTKVPSYSTRKVIFREP